MSARLGDYEYVLPRDLIARRPLERRDDSRMMVLHRLERKIEHRRFRELKTFLRAGDVVVLNDTRVLAARRFSDDGTIEFLFLERLGPTHWKCMVTPGRKMRLGATTSIGGASLRVEKITADGSRLITFEKDVDVYAGGCMPLPPYVNRPGDEADTTRYQTVFAREPGAVAAPTAGLHFTSEMLSEIPHTFVTLHVGPGTFLPVRSEDVADHHMYAETFSISPEAADKINKAQRVLAVGTTVVRVLETAALQTHRLSLEGRAPVSPSRLPNGSNKTYIVSQSGQTDLFVYPPFSFQIVDAMLTNFHLPRSTLLMLVSAFAEREFILHAYGQAVRERYRFYSYGDCMLIL